MIPYILYASLILTACLIFYKLLLQKETFFNLNRYVLLACMMLAFVVPLIHVPQQMSFRKAPSPENITYNIPVGKQNNVTQPADDANSTVAEPVQKDQLINFKQTYY